jgi:hypothetical protein
VLFLTPVFSRLARRRQDLERRARERYDTLDRLMTSSTGTGGSTTPSTPSTLFVEALRTPDRWLVYRAEALWDQPPELDA